MANARTTSVDRRLVQHLVQAIPGTVDENAIKAHLNNAARSHQLIAELLEVDPKKVNLQQFRQALRGLVAVLETRRFASDNVLEEVRALGGQFATAQMTRIPGGETLESQRTDAVIKFWTDWHWKPEEIARLTIEPSIASQVVYLMDLVEGSLGCTYDKVPEGKHKSLEEVMNALPKVSGLRWLVGNLPTVNRVLANHLEATGVHLLPGVYTYTTDSYKSSEYGLGRLIVGYSGPVGGRVLGLRPGELHGLVGLFVLGVPA